jgi:tRNA threonylcarbamoyladenosine biosynthesis protein TsaE
MERLGARLAEGVAACVAGGLTLFLFGDLGAGKTTLTRGLLRALGIGATVKSPTYTLVEPYRAEGANIYHFDLYRLKDPAELEYAGFREYFAPGNLCIVEWPAHGAGILPEPDIEIHFTYLNERHRAVELRGLSARGRGLLQRIALPAPD